MNNSKAVQSWFLRLPLCFGSCDWVDSNILLRRKSHSRNKFLWIKTEAGSVNFKMSYSSGLTARQAAKEHVLAVSRDFISQPRLSKLRNFIFLSFLSDSWDCMKGNERTLAGSSEDELKLITLLYWQIQFKIFADVSESCDQKKKSINSFTDP